MNYHATKTPRHEVLIKTNSIGQMVSIIYVLSDFVPSWRKYINDQV